MTDRFNGLKVFLEKNMRDDDAESLIQAIRQMRGVLSVKGNVADCFEDGLAEGRVRREIGKKIFEILNPERYDA